MSPKIAIWRYLGSSAALVIKREHPFIIAITGSVGKSTTKQMIGAVLRSDLPENRIRISPGSFNNELGLPLSIFGSSYPRRSPLAWAGLLLRASLGRLGLWKTGIKIFVFEMGADKPGDIEYLTSIAPPDIAIITAVTPQDPNLAPVHLMNYVSIDALAEQKTKLIKALRSGGTVILNADDKRVFGMRHHTAEHVITFGEAKTSDACIFETLVIMDAGEDMSIPIGLRAVIAEYGHKYDFKFPGVFGEPIGNAAAIAVGVAAALDISQDQVREMPQHFRPMPGRTRIIPGIKRSILLDDTYNSSPAAVISALKDMIQMDLKPGQRRVACLGEMRELGEEAEALHRQIGAEVARLGLDLLVCCGIFAHAMAEGARANGMSSDQVLVFDDTPEAGLFLQKWIKPGDVVLAKASQGTLETKGVRMERVIKELMADPLRASELLVRQDPAWQRK